MQACICAAIPGTYVDSPLHRFRGGADLAALPLERLAHLPVEVIDVRGERTVGPGCLRGRMLAGRAVLFHTGWSERWRTDAYFEPNPHLTGGVLRGAIGRRGDLRGHR